MKVIVHDLQERAWKDLSMRLHEKDVVIGDGAVKNPADVGQLIGSCSQLVLISRCVYGGFSPYIQEIMEKCRAYFEPVLELRHGQTHFGVKSANKNIFGMVCCFYGDNITPQEEQSARIQSVSDGISLQAKGVKIMFYDNANKLKQLEALFV